jgi:EEF1A N-terminal glycine/lysine methyltransferase
MSLLERLFELGPGTEPEDYLAEAMGVIFPDEIMNQHGDTEHDLEYRSPHLPKPLHIKLADPVKDEDRLLFGHYLWNASLLLAEFVEAGCLGLELSPALGTAVGRAVTEARFDVRTLKTLELGAGTALPSMLAASLGAADVVVTDYPTEPILKTLRENVAYNTRPDLSPTKTVSPVHVEGHEWGDLHSPFATQYKSAFDRLFVCDCLWMPWQHENLQRSISWFLKDDAEARVWVVAGFHTGRTKMCGFFEKDALAAVGLEVEHIWERDADGAEREWAEDRGYEGSIRKRWLVVGILKRVQGDAR